MKIVGFLTNKITLRGTEIAMYDYADYNETYLGNKSIIFTRSYDSVAHESDTDIHAYEKFKDRFQVEYYEQRDDIDDMVSRFAITHLYIIKYGLNDGIISSKCKNFVHCVFDTTQPHGDIYATVSAAVNTRHNTSVPVLPHLIRVDKTDENLRGILNIPEGAIVFGRYGGADTFDIPFVKECIAAMLNEGQNRLVYFLFMNTNMFYEHPNIVYLPGTTDGMMKRKFINTCDALLHARWMGETFGLTCGEFAICKKPVITYNHSLDNNHLDILRDKAVVYSDYDSLYKILTEFTVGKYDMEGNGYLEYDYRYVMDIFNDLFLK